MLAVGRVGILVTRCGVWKEGMMSLKEGGSCGRRSKWLDLLLYLDGGWWRKNLYILFRVTFIFRICHG